MTIKHNSGKEIMTPHGKGIVVAEEIFRMCERWGVQLENNPFSFPVAFYFKNETKSLNKK